MGRISSLPVTARYPVFCQSSIGGFAKTPLSLLGLLILTASLGCQSWHSSTALPGLHATSAQRKVLQQVSRDPFPSPGDVGIVTAN
jgi:hypothetical protein